MDMGGVALAAKPKTRVREKEENSMAKMCPYIENCKSLGYKYKSSVKACAGKNNKCQIIPRREKMVRVKAWARWSIYGEMSAVTGNYEDNTIPCTILIAAKYLKEKP